MKSNNNPNNFPAKIENQSVKNSKLLYIILLMIILCIIVFDVFLFMLPFTLNNSTVNTSTESFNLKETKVFDNALYLTSKNFEIDVENGVSKIKGIFNNSSDEVIRNIDCYFTLLDQNYNIVYELEVPISRIKPNSSSAFSSIAPVDLSNVVNYSVKLAE